MFTFSFSSAFAAVDWTGEATSKYLTEQGDYEINTPVTGETSAADRGTEGITEAYRAELTAKAKAELKYVKNGTPANGTPFYAPEKAEAVAAIEAYIESLKTVKTAKDAAKLEADLAAKVGTWADGTITEIITNGKVTSLKLKTTVRREAKTAGIGQAGTAGDATIDITKAAQRAARGGSFNLYLPGYVTLVKGTNFDAYTGSNTVTLNSTTSTPYTIAGLFTGYGDGTTLAAKVVDWFMDNDYRELADFAEGSKAFTSALVAVSTAYFKTVTDELDAIQLEIDKYADKAADARRGLPASDLEGVDALVKKINAFEEKYAGLTDATLSQKEFKEAITGKTNGALPTSAKDPSLKVCLASNYFDQYYSEVSAVPEVKKLTDADKATVIALYKKVNALEDTYADVWEYVKGATPATAEMYAYDYDKLKDAYEHFLKKDVKAFNDLEKFTEMKKVGTAPNQKAYFDASEKNVNALKAQRAAYDALVKDYGYADLNGTNSVLTYTAAANAEALILAAEHNMGADADYDVKDVTKLQNYLNNATLKVTTTALGNTKIRVQARFDAETYKDIVAECGNDYTISYKFYHKTAKATAFKGPKEKDRNYITYTKLSLKKGVKYKFQCGVVIKDAQGNVVAEKSYKASTTGSRVCR